MPSYEEKSTPSEKVEAATTWKYSDVDRNDPLVARRIAVTARYWPEYSYILMFDKDSEVRPTEAEALLLQTWLEEYKEYFYRDSYKNQLNAEPLDVDGGANGVMFHKYGEDDWAYCRMSWEGQKFHPGPAWFREQYGEDLPPKFRNGISLGDLMDHEHSIAGTPSKRWEEWKAAHPEVFGVSAC